jgi:four helix bundle protein
MQQAVEKQKIASFTQLIAWQKAHALVVDVYKATDQFPAVEQFGLTSQIKRAVISITSNIAEGFSRQTKPDKIHFYHIALGSCTEVQNQLMAARDLEFLSVSEFKNLADLSVEVHKILNGLIKSLKDNK